MFDIGNQTYVTAVLGLGGLVIAIGVLMVFVWFMFLCCRSCVDCCRKDSICGNDIARAWLLVVILVALVSMIGSYQGWSKFRYFAHLPSPIPQPPLRNVPGCRTSLSIYI